MAETNLLKRKNKKSNPDRYEFLKCLINELYSTKNLESRKETLANLANFAYNPLNYVHFQQLHISDVFFDMLTDDNKDLRSYALAGLCNLAADEKNRDLIIAKSGTKKISEFIHASAEEGDTLNAVTALFYLVTPNKHTRVSNAYLLKVGDIASVTRIITADDVRKFADLTGDFNTVHLIGSNPIVHGVFLNGLVSAVIGTQLPGHGTLVAQQTLRFPKPCYVGEEVTIKVEVMSIRKIATVKFNVNVPLENKTVLEGEAKLITPKL